MPLPRPLSTPGSLRRILGPLLPLPTLPALRVILSSLVVVSLLSSPTFASVGSLFQKELIVFTVTDVTDVGKTYPRPQPGKPVYYEACSLGYMDIGRSKAGHRVPSRNKMLKRIVKTLADQGYVVATKENPPTIFLVFFWGTMSSNYGNAVKFMGGDKYNLMWEFENTPQNHNPNILLRGTRSAEADMIMQVAQDEIYVASVQAYDQPKLREGQAVLLWETKISAPSLGLIMDQSLDQMISIAGPQFGQETVKPNVRYSSERKENIELGELEVLDMIDPETLPIAEWNRTLNQAEPMRREIPVATPTPTPTPAAKP